MGCVPRLRTAATRTRAGVGVRTYSKLRNTTRRSVTRTRHFVELATERPQCAHIHDGMAPNPAVRTRKSEVSVNSVPLCMTKAAFGSRGCSVRRMRVKHVRLRNLAVPLWRLSARLADS